MYNKVDFLLSLQEIKNNFNAENIDDYKEFIDLLNLIMLQNEEDDDILNEILKLIQEINNKAKNKNQLEKELKNMRKYADKLLSSYFKTPHHEKGKYFI